MFYSRIIIIIIYLLTFKD